MNNGNQPKLLSFKELGIHPEILSVLQSLEFKEPTPIQAQAIPDAIAGKDIIGIAQTGTGKTLAFAIPMIQKLLQDRSRGLILAPTRELAMQINDSIKIVGRLFGIRTAVLIGGEAKFSQIRALKNSPNIIIATPGRLMDHYRSKTLKLDNISFVTLDEADQMFDMGFAPKIKEILEMIPRNRQTLLFSATMPASILQLVKQYMASPIRIEVAPSGTPAKDITQEIIVTRTEDKVNQLEKILVKYNGTVLVFVRTKHGAKNLFYKIRDLGHTVAEIHSNRTLSQRMHALHGFKSGKFRVLVATDIAARGIDVKEIELVLNYDLPDCAEDYVHRIGRTGRAGKEGQAISLATPGQKWNIEKIEQLIKRTIPLTEIEKMYPSNGDSNNGKRFNKFGNGRNKRNFTRRNRNNNRFYSNR